MSDVFLLSWDMLGLETCVNVSEMERQRTFDTLKGHKPTNSINVMINAIILRARYNAQRHYEVYTVAMDREFSKHDVETAFNANPQAFAELIRKRGNCLFSARYEHDKAVIT